jgi:urease gamma subunit
VPIRPFLGDRAFEPEMIVIMSAALERSCEALGLKLRDDAATRLVASKIIEAAQGGIDDPITLSSTVLREFER